MDNENKLNREKALRRIEKCLALSASANPNEAATALRQAHKLMQEYGLSQGDLEANTMGSLFFDSGFKRIPAWALLVISLCADAFGCVNFVSSGGRIVYVGDKDHIAIARYAYDVVMRQLKSNLKSFQADNIEYILASVGRKKKLSQSYCEAWASAADDVVTEFAKPVTDSRRKDLTEKFEADQGVSVGAAIDRKPASDQSTASAIRSGFSDGADVRLHAPVGAESSQRLHDND